MNSGMSIFKATRASFHETYWNEFIDLLKEAQIDIGQAQKIAEHIEIFLTVTRWSALMQGVEQARSGGYQGSPDDKSDYSGLLGQAGGLHADTLECISKGVRDCAEYMDLRDFEETFDILIDLHTRIDNVIKALRSNEKPTGAFPMDNEQ